MAEEHDVASCDEPNCRSCWRVAERSLEGFCVQALRPLEADLEEAWTQFTNTRGHAEERAAFEGAIRRLLRSRPR